MKSSRLLHLIVLAGCLPILNLALAEETIPLSLEQAIAEAIAGNPEVSLAESRIEISRAMLQSAEALSQPTFGLQSSYIRTDHPVRVFGAALMQQSFSPTLNFNNVPDADNLNVTGILKAPIYTSGGNPARQDAAARQKDAATSARDGILNTLSFQVAATYFTILKSRAFEDAAQAAVHSHEQNLVIAQRRMEAGKALRADILDLEVRLAEAREQKLLAANGTDLALHALARLLGWTDRMPEVLPGFPSLAAPPLEAVPNRPEIQALKQQKLAAEAQVRAVQSGTRPQVSAFVSAEQNRGWRFNGQGNAYTTGVQVDWNIWDGSLTRSRVREARLQVELVEEELRRLEADIHLEIRQARLRLSAAEQRLEVTSKAVELAQESVTLTRSRFEQGLALTTQLLDAETSLTAARVRRAEAEADRSIALASLRKALGLAQMDSPSQP